MEAQLFSKLQMFDLILIERAVFVVPSGCPLRPLQQSPELSLENVWNIWVCLA